MERVRLGLGVLGAGALLAAAAWLLRARPEVPAARLSERSEAPPPAPAPGVPPRTPSALVLPPNDGSSPRSDSLGIPQDPEKIAREVVEMAKAYAAAAAKAKGELVSEHLAALDQTLRELRSKITEWTGELIHRKAFGFRELFASLLREDEYFKQDAAYYLAALPDGAGHGPLLEAMNGTSLLGRAAAATALAPRLEGEVPAALRTAFRKALADDLSGVHDDEAAYGAEKAAAAELAGRLRSAAVRVLTRAKDVDAVPLLIDAEAGKDGVAWSPRTAEDVDALYRHLAERLSASPSPTGLDRLAGAVDAWLAPRGPLDGVPAGNAWGAALLLDALGRPDALRRMREHHVEALRAGRNPLGDAGALLTLRDTRGLDVLLNALTDPVEGTRNRAVTMLAAASGQKIGTGLELHGEGSGADRARWAEVRQLWSEWWTRNRQAFQSNPYASR